MKLSKIAAVIFLTVLIWVWADLAVDETYDTALGSIVLTDSSPELWISFDGERSISIDNIKLKGPASKITNVKRIIENHSLSMLFPLDAEKEGLVDNGEPLNVQSFLQKSAQFQDSGLVIESCEPVEISVSVVQLSEQSLGVDCYDENGDLLTVESIVEPETVNILVPDAWLPADKARVVLTRNEIEQAKSEPIEKKAHITLSDGQTRESSTTIEITIPPEEQRLKRFEIQATIGYCGSTYLLSRYTVELLNQQQVIGEAIQIRATNEAKTRYEGQDEPKMTLYIYERDETGGQQMQIREVHYNFPLEDVRNGDIMLDQTPVTAQFKLVPLSSAENP